MVSGFFLTTLVAGLVAQESGPSTTIKRLTSQGSAEEVGTVSFRDSQYGMIIEPKLEAPVEVIAPQPTVPIVAMFLEPSKTTALLAAAVPSVIPSGNPWETFDVVESNRSSVKNDTFPIEALFQWCHT